jgi:nucleotide-binding universal stress UspA family protein
MNMFKHILVPTDFSPSSAAALELALDLATQLDAELTLLHVWEIPVYPYLELMMSTAEMTNSVEKAASECLETKLKEIQSRLPRAKSSLRMGLPWQQIVEAIKESKADLLVMGTHGRRGFAHALMGSVAEKLVRLSPVPVLTVRGAPAP